MHCSFKAVYHDPHELYESVKGIFADVLPLHQVTFKTIRNSECVLDSVPIQLVSSSASEFAEPRASYDYALAHSPFLDILLIDCASIETYRSSVRPYIRDWLNQEKKNEWIVFVLLIQPSISKGAPSDGDSLSKNKHLRASRKSNSHTSSASNLRNTLTNKMLSDFEGSSKHRRCCVYSSTNSEEENLKMKFELKTLVNDCFLRSLNKQFEVFQSQVKEMDAMRLNPGWNFFTFFALKENIALLSQKLGLCNDALLIYDELEASFFQYMKERSASEQSFYGPQLYHAEFLKPLNVVNLFAAEDPESRSKIVHSKIDPFALKMYIYSRQCYLLNRLKRKAEILKRTKDFILFINQYFVKTKAGCTATTYNVKLADFTYKIVELSLDHVYTSDSIASSNSQYVALACDLHLMQKAQLDLIGLSYNYIQKSRDFYHLGLFFPREQGSTALTPPESFFSSTLMDAVATENSFLKLYLSIIQAVLKEAESCKRLFVVDQMIIAVFHIYNRLNEDERGAAVLLRHSLLNNLKISKPMNMISSIHSKLELFIKTLIKKGDLGQIQEICEARAQANDIEEDSAVSLRDEILEYWQSVPELTKETPLTAGFFFEVKPSCKMNIDSETGQSALSLSLRSLTSKPIELILIELFLEYKEGNFRTLATLTSNSIVAFSPGSKNATLCLYCDTVFTEPCSIIGWKLTANNKLKFTSHDSRFRSLVQPVPLEHLPLDLSSHMPTEYTLKKARNLVVKFKLNSDQISTNEIDINYHLLTEIESCKDDIKLFDSHGSLLGNFKDPHLILKNISSGTFYEIQFPYNHNNKVTEISFILDILLNYKGSNTKKLRVITKQKCHFHYLLSIAMNEIYRESSALLKFTLSCATEHDCFIEDIRLDCQQNKSLGVVALPQNIFNYAGPLAQKDKVHVMYQVKKNDSCGMLDPLILTVKYKHKEHELDSMQLIIPFELSGVDILHSISWKFPRGLDGPYNVGTPIQVSLSIISSSKWKKTGPFTEESPRRFEFIYEIEQSNYWAVEGNSRSQFVAKLGWSCSYSTTLTLIPLVAGNLTPPPVYVGKIHCENTQQLLMEHYQVQGSLGCIIIDEATPFVERITSQLSY